MSKDLTALLVLLDTLPGVRYVVDKSLKRSESGEVATKIVTVFRPNGTVHSCLHFDENNQLKEAT